MLEPADRLAIHELLAYYGHVLDGRQWELLDRLFTLDAICDFRGAAAARVFNNLAELREFWSSPAGEAVHPLAHHITNVVVTGINNDGSVAVICKGIGVGKNGRVGSVSYSDIVVRTANGWRIAHRVARLRKAPGEPGSSV